MRGEVYRLAARGEGDEQRGRRYAVVLQPDWLALSTLVVAFTSTSARPTSFRPSVVIAGGETLVMCDQLATADTTRLSDEVGSLTFAEMQDVDEALTLVLNPWSRGALRGGDCGALLTRAYDRGFPTDR